MNNKKNKWVDKTFEHFKQHPLRAFLFFLLIGFFVQTIIQSFYWIGRWKGIPTDYSAGEVLSFWGSFFTFLGTFALGALALMQNNRLNKINERLLEIEEAKFSPMLDFSWLERDIFTKVNNPAISNNYLMFCLDNKYCTIGFENIVENLHEELTWIFDCENTSEVRIIGMQLTQIVVNSLMADGDLISFTSNNISSSGNERFAPQENKPLIISGIKNFFNDQDDTPPILQLNLSFNLTNSIGDIYSTKMSFFVSCEDPKVKVMFPDIHTKIFEKPRKIM